MSTSVVSLQSPRVASIDRLRSDDLSIAAQIAAISLFALLTALGAQVKIFLWEVPFSLQTLAVFGSGLFLGWRNGALAQLLYLTLGLFLPVYAGDAFGLSYFFVAASAGYLIACPIAAALIGYLSGRWNSFAGSALSVAVGAMVIFTIGVIWLHFAAGHATFWESIDKGFLRFAVFDLIKIALAAGLYTGLRRMG